MKGHRWNCRCFFCDDARWEVLWEEHKTTPEYVEAAAKEQSRISGILNWGLPLGAHPAAPDVADGRLKFDFFRNLGRWMRRKPPLFSVAKKREWLRAASG